MNHTRGDLAVFLEINGESVTHARNDDVYELVMEVASSRFDLARIVARLVALAQA